VYESIDGHVEKSRLLRKGDQEIKEKLYHKTKKKELKKKLPKKETNVTGEKGRLKVAIRGRIVNQ